MTTEGKGHLTQKPWGTCQGKDVVLFRLTNGSGAYVELTNYGATLVSVVVPDKLGMPENVILGYPSLHGYLSDACYIGATIGRYANRIADAQFELDGVTYQLEKNDGHNTLHGGLNGFNARVFSFQIHSDKLVFSLLSDDGDGGYPGNLAFSVEYQWNDRNELSIRYMASSDKKTVANFTNHAYFNLSPARDDIFDHRLTIQASRLLETSKHHIPTGTIIPAGEKNFSGHKIHERLVINAGIIAGLNTYYLFDRKEPVANEALCRLSDDLSGRILDVFTTYPGVQLYTGDFLASTELSNRRLFHKPFDGLCLECQYFPDSPNHSHFPSTVLEPGKPYNETITYRFGIEE